MQPRTLIATGSLFLSLTVTGALTSSVAESQRSASVVEDSSALHGAHQGNRPPRAVAPYPRIRPLLPVVDQGDIELRHRLMADEVVRLLPESCWGTLRNFYVRYTPMKDRGLAGKDSAVISGLVPDSEFRSLLVHEIMGHVFDLGCLAGTPENGSSAFRDGKEIMWNDDPSVAYYKISWTDERTKRKGIRPAHFLSRYAHDSDSYEDLAEGAVMYVLHNDLFRKRAAENPIIAGKLAWFEKYLPLPASAEPLSRSLAVWDGKKGPSWDATKLPYVWHSDAARVASTVASIKSPE